MKDAEILHKSAKKKLLDAIEQLTKTVCISPSSP
jgi:hypothetical protein